MSMWGNASEPEPEAAEWSEVAVTGWGEVAAAHYERELEAGG
jgi:hypothetical protein